MSKDDDYKRFLQSIRERIAKLMAVPDLDHLPQQTVSSTFPVISDQELQIARDALFAIAETYGMAVEDIHVLTKAYQLIFGHGLSTLLGRQELASLDVALKVIWH